MDGVGWAEILLLNLSMYIYVAYVSTYSNDEDSVIMVLFLLMSEHFI